MEEYILPNAEELGDIQKRGEEANLSSTMQLSQSMSDVRCSHIHADDELQVVTMQREATRMQKEQERESKAKHASMSHQ